MTSNKIADYEKVIIEFIAKELNIIDFMLNDEIVAGIKFNGNKNGYYLYINGIGLLSNKNLNPQAFFMSIEIDNAVVGFTIVIHSNNVIEIEKWHDEETPLDRNAKHERICVLNISSK